MAASSMLNSPLLVPAVVVLATVALAVLVMGLLSGKKRRGSRSALQPIDPTHPGTILVKEDGLDVRRSTR